MSVIERCQARAATIGKHSANYEFVACAADRRRVGSPF